MVLEQSDIIGRKINFHLNLVPYKTMNSKQTINLNIKSKATKNFKINIEGNSLGCKTR